MKEFFTSRFITLESFFETQQFPTTDWKNLFTADYWTSGPLASTSPYYLFGWILALIALVALEVWRRRLKKAQTVTPVYSWPLNQISNLFYYLLILLLGYWFFRTQQLAYLSSRLMLGAILLGGLIWLIWIWVYMKRRIPQLLQSHLERERFFRYLPKNKSGAPKRPGQERKPS